MRFLPFRSLKRVPLLSLEAHLPFAYEPKFTGVECQERWKDEFWAARDERGRDGRVECSGVCDELAEGGAVERSDINFLAVIQLGLFSNPSIEGPDVVKWDVDGAVVDFADSIELLFVPCCSCLCG